LGALCPDRHLAVAQPREVLLVCTRAAFDLLPQPIDTDPVIAGLQTARHPRFA